MRDKELLIECIAKESYDNFFEVICETEELRRGRQIVIFGAGIMGMQFAYTLIQLGVENFIFCVNASDKWGSQLIDTFIKEPKYIENVSQYFVFLAMENYEQCANQLEKMGYRLGETWINLTNCSGKRLLETFDRNDDAKILVLGDCSVSTVSVQEKDKVSIGELLEQIGTTKVLALNGLYMREYYNILRLCKKKMPQLETVYLLLNVDVMSNRYFLYPKNQHSKIMKELYEKADVSDEEMREFIDIAVDREKKVGILDISSPNRQSNLTENEIENQRRVHMKLNFLYKISENTENMEYLDAMLDFCRINNIKITYVIMPINYEMGETYFGEEFKVRYNQIITVICRHIEKGRGEILDLSYLLTKKDFICIRSTNEGIRALGRKLISDKIIERMTGRCQ